MAVQSSIHRRVLTGVVSSILSVGMLAGAARAADPAPASPKLFNAALSKYGAKIDLALSADGGKDKRSSPEETFDGNPHSRCVVWGLPYTYTIDLPVAVKVERIDITFSDYKELAAKDIKIELDDGTVIKQTLELKRPEKNTAAWQSVAIGKSVKKVKVTVESNFDEPDSKAKYGGLGEIAVLTSEDLDQQLKVDFDPKQPVFIHAASADDRAPAKVTMPVPAKAGEHPCLLMTKAEIDDLRQTLKSTDKGKEALAALIKSADALCAGAVEFPDPKGPPGQLHSRNDPVAKKHDDLAKGAETLGIAYSITNDAKYAKRAAEILVGYAKTYDFYAEHKGVNGSDTGKIMSQRLSEAMWIIPLIAGYDYVYDSGGLTAADHEIIDRDLIRACVLFIRRKDFAAEVKARDAKAPNWRTEGPTGPKGKGAGNWVNFYAAATVMGGAVTGDKDMIDLGAGDYRQLLHDGIGEDGMWAEGAVGYQLFALGAMITGMESAAHQGIDLYSYDNSRVKMMFDSTLRYAYPDGTAPGINDSSRAKIGGWQTMVYDYGYLRFNDERYAPIVNDSPRQLQASTSIYFPTRIFTPLPEPKAITYPSMNLSRVGYAITRGPGRYDLLKYGPHGGPHGHYDKLNLILFAGDELGGEPKFYPYENPLCAEWTRQTVAHNTMTVDERAQIAAEGLLTVFEDSGDMRVMRGQVAGAYPGVLLERTVLSTNDLVLDLYTGSGGRERTWDRTLRFNGKITGLPTVADAPALGTGFGYQHLKVMKREPAAAESWQATWQTKPAPLTAWVAGQAGQEAISLRGPEDDQIVLIRQKGATGNFGMAYALSDKAAVTAVRKSYDVAAGVSILEADAQGGKIQLFVAQKPGAWTAGGWQSDARVLCIRQHGDETQVLVCGGTTAKGPAGDLQLKAPGNCLATGNAGKLAISSEWARPDR